jgi:hypothetical protein
MRLRKKVLFTVGLKPTVEKLKISCKVRGGCYPIGGLNGGKQGAVVNKKTTLTVCDEKRRQIEKFLFLNCYPPGGVYGRAQLILLYGFGSFITQLRKKVLFALELKRTF